MKVLVVLLFSLGTLLSSACSSFAQDWPERTGRTPEQMLEDLIRLQQLKHVKQSTGEMAHEAFTDLDYEAFRAADVPQQIVSRLKGADDFAIVAAALRALPSERLAAGLLSARRIARPTWRQMGFIDAEGRGQTEAGHFADLSVADAIANAFSAEGDGK